MQKTLTNIHYVLLTEIAAKCGKKFSEKIRKYPKINFLVWYLGVQANFKNGVRGGVGLYL